ncbi:MAG TPA: PilZ domain-containing protein [Geobacteraceae bacterium]
MKKKKILLGVSERSFSTLESVFSSEEKFHVWRVSDGDEVLRFFSSEKPDLAFLDVNLPGLSGDTCCDVIKKANCYPGTSIVLLAAAGNCEEVERCRRAGSDAILLTPLSHARVAILVTSFLYDTTVKQPRVAVRLPVSYSLGAGGLKSDFSVNLSTGGTFIEARRTLPIDTPLMVSFTLPDTDTDIRCTARVAWLNGPIQRSTPLLPVGMGLQFLDLDDRHVQAIDEFLASTPPTAPGGEMDGPFPVGVA